MGDHVVEVTHPDRVLFPDAGITKGEVVDYYRRVAEVMLPHLRGRPLMLQRFPRGIDASGFYMKDVPDHFPDWVHTAAIPRRERGGTIEQAFLCDQPAALVYLANQGTLTFHVWPTRADRLDTPDLMVFDLDPPDGDVTSLRDAARSLRDVLQELSLVPFLQTSGSKGYHVVVPLDGTTDLDAVRDVARGVAEYVAGHDPDRLTTAQRKSKRGDRIFIDTNRNAYAQTFAAPYAIRARPGAPVATPIDWHELGRAEPTSYTVGNLFRRLGQKHDPWADLHEHATGLDNARGRLAELVEAAAR
ncbi:MAG: non-homologous end-joining DNA ligase [Actinobacteria bacterium]|nr:non-homologous end-joining DNA ligase [Actinomycetota bacterium]